MQMATMTHHWVIVGLLVVDLYIQGALCSGYEGGGIIGGLVATSVIGFLILIAAIVMILVAMFGRNWYTTRQASLGICKKPREQWSFFESKLKASPMSERKVDTRTYYLPSDTTLEGRVTTLGRTPINRGARITRLPVSNSTEAKTRTMNVEPEEGEFIVMEVMPNTTQQTNMRSSQQDKTPQSTFVDDTKAESVYSGAVIINDSDDEAGNIPNQMENIVLF